MHVPVLFAANATALDRLKEVPADIWMKLGLGILGLVVVVLVLRKIAKVNKVVLGIVVVVGLSFLGFNWIYKRTEPAWATPFVEPLAHFFPTKGPMKQKNLPK